jgi:antitoxin MazE
MKTRMQKWGNSLALRIPRSFAVEAGLEQNSAVEISLMDGKLVIAPLKVPDFTLAHLLAQVSDENLHREVDTGPALGGEVW